MKHQFGASLLEFLLVSPLVLIVGLGAVQTALVYHGKSILHYATFEAARAGSVNNASLSEMRKAFGLRIAPIVGGDGTQQKAAEAIGKAKLLANDVTRTKIHVLNPTLQAFQDWGVVDARIQQLVIPNTHLRFKSTEIGQNSNLNLQDANLLKIKVTFGLTLKVPVVGPLFASAMRVLDPTHAWYYARDQIPLTAVATVRMQSEAWKSEVAEAQPPTETPSSTTSRQRSGATRIPNIDTNFGGTPIDNADGDSADSTPVECVPQEASEEDFGLGPDPILVRTSDYLASQCASDHPAFTTPPLTGDPDSVDRPSWCE